MRSYLKLLISSLLPMFVVSSWLCADGELSPSSDGAPQADVERHRQSDDCPTDRGAVEELELVLEREFDALTIQTEGKALLDTYVRCAEPHRVVCYLRGRIGATPPEVRIWFLRSLADVGNAEAMDVLIDALSDDSVYGYLGKEPTLISESALVLVKRVFTQSLSTDSSEKQMWRDWWECVGDGYRQVESTTMNDGEGVQRK